MSLRTLGPWDVLLETQPPARLGLQLEARWSAVKSKWTPAIPSQGPECPCAPPSRMAQSGISRWPSTRTAGYGGVLAHPKFTWLLGGLHLAFAAMHVIDASRKAHRRRHSTRPLSGQVPRNGLPELLLIKGQLASLSWL